MATPILLRADITPDEWKRLRVVAIERSTSPREIVTTLLRDYIDLHDPKPVAK